MIKMEEIQKCSHEVEIEMEEASSSSSSNDITGSTSQEEVNSCEYSSLPIILTKIKKYFLSILKRFHAGYFRISLSLCSQVLLWKILGESSTLKRVFTTLPSCPPLFILLWSLSLLTLSTLSLLYLLRCFFLFKMVKAEFSHHVGVNYLFTPSISWLLLLQSSPFISSRSHLYLIMWLVFVAPVLILDVKIYGQWFTTKGKRFLSNVANPTSQLSVIGNLIGARAAAEMGWTESAVCMFSLGMAHYLVVFVTLYQRLSGGNRLPAMLTPVFFLFFAAPCAASLAWNSICGSFDNSSKMLFFLSLFLFLSLVCRPNLFKKSMKRYNVAWWAYSFPVTVLALASVEYADEVKSVLAHWLMLSLSSLSLLNQLTSYHGGHSTVDEESEKGGRMELYSHFPWNLHAKSPGGSGRGDTGAIYGVSERTTPQGPNPLHN